jgi:SAM-dependent methyltransferase
MSIDRIRRHYLPRLARGQENFEKLDWSAEQSQLARFEVLPRAVDLSGRSLLDVGCGLGDLAWFLDEHRLSVEYTGLDVLEEMVSGARNAHPGRRFVIGDLFGPDDPLPGETFDIVFCSGALNLNLDNNLEFAERALAIMAGRAETALVVNFLHVREPAGDSRYFHYDPAAIRDILGQRDLDVRILEDYLPNDFTAVATPKPRN